jgi:hypothetical protein
MVFREVSNLQVCCEIFMKWVWFEQKGCGLGVVNYVNPPFEKSAYAPGENTS